MFKYPLQDPDRMIFVHSVGTFIMDGGNAYEEAEKRALSILKEGIKPAKDTGIRNYNETDENYVYFCLVEEKWLAKTPSPWGSYSFCLRKEYVLAHLDDFIGEGETKPESFWAAPDDSGLPARLRKHYEAASKLPIPIEALDKLIVDTEYVASVSVMKILRETPNHLEVYNKRGNNLEKFSPITSDIKATRI